MWGSIGASAISAGSNIAGSIYSARKAEEAARAQMAFQKEAYQNRYQWQMQDMQKAGLNPALAYSQGAGSAPSGAQPTNFAEGLKDTGAIALNAYLDTLQKKQSINTAKAQEEKTKEEAETVRQLRPFTIEQTRTSAKANEANAYYGNPLKLGGNILDSAVDYLDLTNAKEKIRKAIDNIGQDVKNSAKEGGSYLKDKYNQIKGWFNKNNINNLIDFLNYQPFKQNKKDKK